MSPNWNWIASQWNRSLHLTILSWFQTHLIHIYLSNIRICITIFIFVVNDHWRNQIPGHTAHFVTMKISFQFSIKFSYLFRFIHSFYLLLICIAGDRSTFIYFRFFNRIVNEMIEKTNRCWSRYMYKLCELWISGSIRYVTKQNLK